MSSENSENKETTGNQPAAGDTFQPTDSHTKGPANGAVGQSNNGGNGSEGNGVKGANGHTVVRKSHSPPSVEYEVVEPWPEPVNGVELLDGIVKVLERFSVLPKWAAATLALWVVHTYAFLLREVTTYIGIESPEKECGKSTLLTLLSRLVNRPAVSSNISSSAFYRVIEEGDPTVLIDEGDTNLRGKDDLRGSLNSGYTKGTAFVWRTCFDGAPGPEAEEREGEGGGSWAAGRVAQYSSWCPKAIAAIGRLDPVLASRCIVFTMHRKRKDEQCERLKYLETGELKRKCARFVADHADEIAKAEPAIPPGLTNRAADIWQPLLVLADVAGGRWPALAREAALGLTAQAEGHSPIGALLLDIFVVFILAKRDRVFTRELVEGLQGREDRPWVELRRGKLVTQMRLAQQLRAYGIRPRTIRIGDQVAKGYLEEDFMDTFRRYIPKSEVDALKAEMEEGLKKEGIQPPGEEPPDPGQPKE